MFFEISIQLSFKQKIADNTSLESLKKIRRDFKILAG